MKSTNISTIPAMRKAAFRFRLQITIFVFSVSLLFISCGGKKSEGDLVAPPGTHMLDLSRFGKPFIIFVPDTVTQKLSVIEQTSGSLDIKVGSTFAVSINEQEADIELKKTDIKEDEVNKLKAFVLEEPNAIMWESEITSPEFHFLMNQKIGNAVYSFEDIKDPGTNPFSKEAIQKMVERCKDVKEVKKDAKS